MKKLILLIILCISPLQAMTNHDYENWWTSFRNNVEVPLDLKMMEDYFIDSGSLVYSSNFWNDWNKKNIEQLTFFGFDHFKQTVAGNYFTWKVSIDHPYAINLKNLVSQLNIEFAPEELHRKHTLWTSEESLNFNIITMYYLNYMVNSGWGSYIDLIEEPLVGNPPYNLYNGKRVSQDIFNSLQEYLSVVHHCPMDNISTILEIGAGYGRTAYCFLKFHPEKKYIIVDFPPALYVSQTYLSQVFPEKKVMKFRAFEQFSEIAEEFSQANIIFLTPDQLSKIPNESIDLMLAIDCLHEMKADRVEHYFKEAERLSHYFYYKCWVKTYVSPDDVYHLENSYPVQPHWIEIFRQPCQIPSGFFHAFYQMKPSKS